MRYTHYYVCHPRVCNNGMGQALFLGTLVIRIKDRLSVLTLSFIAYARKSTLTGHTSHVAEAVIREDQP